MLIRKRVAMLAAFMAIFLLLTVPFASVRAEDCTPPGPGTLPDTNCTLDEDTTADLTIGQNVVLTISAGGLAPGPLVIGHLIDGKNAIEIGEIDTAGNGGIIHQTADIGSINALREVTINNGDIWYMSSDADIILESLAVINIDGGILGIGPSSALSMISAGIRGGAGDEALDFISGGVSIGTTGTIGRVGETIDLAGGNDRILYYQSLGSSILADTVAVGHGDNLFGILGTSITSVFGGRFIGGTGVDVVAFFSGSDAILGSSSAEYFFGADNDILDFDSGAGVAGGRLLAQTLDFDAGDDLINITDNAVIVLSSSGTITMDEGDDLISFTSGGYIDARGSAFAMGDDDDILLFNDITYDGVTGLDVSGGTFNMGDGEDTIIFGSHSVGLNATGTTIALGNGNDRILFTSGNGGTITLVSGSGFLAVNGGNGDDAIYFGSNAAVTVGDAAAGGNISNMEIIDVGGGTLSYHGDIDDNADIINFTSASFFGVSSDIQAFVSGSDVVAESVLFASGVRFSGSADLGAGDDTVTFRSATLTGTVSLDDGGDNFVIGGDSIVTGTVNGGNDANDSLTFTSGLTVISGGGSIINFTSGEVQTGATVNIRTPGALPVDLYGAGTVQFGSAGSTADTYNLTNDIDGVALEIVGDTVDTNGIDLGATTSLRGLMVDQNSLFIVDSTVDLADGAGGNAGILDVNGTMRFEPTAIVMADDYEEGTTGTFIFEIDRNGGVTTVGTIQFEDAVDIDFTSATGSGDTFRFVLGPASGSLVTDSVSFISAAGGQTVFVPEAGNIIGNTILYDIALLDDNANPQDLELVITQTNTIESLTNTKNNQTLATVLLEGLLNSTTEDIVALREAILNTSNAEEFNRELEAALPIVDRSALSGVDIVNRRTFGLINQRLAMLRKDREGNTGISTGNLAEELEVWWQFYGASADQDAKNDVRGYESTTYGLATGIDKEMFEDAFFGLSFAWGETSANSKAAGDSDTEVDSYQLSLYGDYDLGRAYINGMLSYSYNDISTAKTSAAGTRTAGYHANHYAARAEMGMTFLTGKTRLIPHIMGHYGYFGPESYKEEGPAAQIISKDSVKIMEAGAGLDMQWIINNGNDGHFVPEMRLGYRYDFADEAVIATTQYVAGGPEFQIDGFDPSEQAFDFGLGVTYFSEKAWELLFNYDLEYREDYMSHAGMVRASYKFYQ